MQNETLEFLSIVEKHLESMSEVEKIVLQLKQENISIFCTLARGSSDHAALFAKYLIENKLGKLVCSFAPSVHTLYKSPIDFKSTLLVAISQSGQSDDLVQTLRFANTAGAVTLSIVNEVDSPLAKEANYLIPLHAGVEQSVAATKSFLASISRIIQFVAILTNDIPLLQKYFLFPGYLKEVVQNYGWEKFLTHLKKVNSMYVIGRGYGFPFASEAALKLKETCAIHAEAVSGAEVLHGPFELIDEKFCCFVFLQKDETLASMLQFLEHLLEKKCKVFIVATKDILNSLNEHKFYLLSTAEKSMQPVLDLTLSMICFYRFVCELALLRGRNPDKPKNLSKVTRTI